MSLFSSMSDSDGSGSSIWSKGVTLFNIASPLNDLLEHGDFTIEDLLDEDELIQEVKSRNHLLLEFLSKEESIKKMIQYIVNPDPDNRDDTKRLKFPFMSCEVICCDILCITETLVSINDGELLDLLFTFMDQAAPLDSRHAGYFEKIVSLLMIRKPSEIAVCINRQSDILLQNFIRHSDSFSVSELFKRLLQPLGSDFMDDGLDFNGFGMNMGMGMGLLSMDSMGLYLGNEGDGMTPGTPSTSTVEPLLWQQDPNVVSLLVKKLTPLSDEGSLVDPDVHKHVAEVLVDIIHCGVRNQDESGESVLVDFLESQEIVDSIIDSAIPNGCENVSSSSMTSSLSVLGALLSRHSNTQYHPIPTEEEIPIVVSSTLNRMEQLRITLRAEDHEPGILVTQCQENVTRLGLRRLKLVGLVVLLIQSRYHKVDSTIIEHSILPACIDLFFNFHLVNLLHADIESMIVTIIENGSASLQRGLICECRLLERIVNAYSENEEVKQLPKGTSRGYMGHLNRISNVLVAVTEEAKDMIETPSTSLQDMTNADLILDLLGEDPELWSRWTEFTSTTLAKINEQDSCPLGGVPAPCMEVDEQDAYEAFSKSDHMLNSDFPEILESGEGFEDYDGDIQQSDLGAGYRQDPPLLPEILDDSSSSEDEDFEDFNPRGESAVSSLDSTSSATSPPPAPADTTVDGQHAHSWKAFEDSGEISANPIENSSTNIALESSIELPEGSDRIS